MQPPPRRQRAMEHPERQRHPLRPQQFQVEVVVEAERGEGEDHARDEGGRRIAGQLPHEQECADAARHEAAEHEQVEDVDGRQPGPDPGRGNQPLEQHRVRERQRARYREVDVCVEEMHGIARQLVGNPREAPQIEVRVHVVGHAPRTKRLRPRQADRQRGEQDAHSEHGHPAAGSAGLPGGIHQRHAAPLPPPSPARRLSRRGRVASGSIG